MSDSIIAIFKSTFPFLHENDINELLEISNFRRFKNKEIIIKSNELNRKIFFIVNGMVRGYFLNDKDEEKNIFLRPQHTITGAPECLFHSQPTKYTFESILESDLLVFEMDDFLQLADRNPIFHKVYIMGLQENVQTLISRVESLIDLSPAQRYENLLQRSPQFFQTAFNKHIANYLGITPVSLSRIIKRRKRVNS